MPAKKISNIAAVVSEISRPIIESFGLLLWDVLFIKEGTNFILRIIIDKSNDFVSINDCEIVTKAIDPILDEKDLIEQSYIFEVSSPGINRILTKNHHFDLYKNKKIFIQLIRPFENKREFTGVLQEYNNNIITILSDDDIIYSFNKKDTSKITSLDE